MQATRQRQQQALDATLRAAYTQTASAVELRQLLHHGVRAPQKTDVASFVGLPVAATARVRA